MNNHPNDNRWKELCQAILDEPDPVKLQELARMLNDELEAQEKEAEEKRSDAARCRTAQGGRASWARHRGGNRKPDNADSLTKQYGGQTLMEW